MIWLTISFIALSGELNAYWNYTVSALDFCWSEARKICPASFIYIYVMIKLQSLMKDVKDW